MVSVIEAPARPAQIKSGNDAVRQFAIEGMTCASCVGRVERAIQKVPGVTAAFVNLATERAEVAFSGVPQTEAILNAIEDAGYSVPKTTVELAIEGMTCASCVGRAEKALKAVPGVSEASVSLATQRATIRVSEGAVDVSELTIRPTGGF